jgi:hypothetical protein
MAADTAFKRSDFYSIASFCSVIVPVGQSDEEIRERNFTLHGSFELLIFLK